MGELKKRVEKYRKGVFIVVYKKLEKKILYLILKRKLHWRGWEFCKGGVELNENIKGVVAREVFEETGRIATSIKNHKKTGKYKYQKTLKDRPGIIGQTYSLYSAEVKNKKVKISKKEHSGFKWLEFDKAVKLLTYKNQKECLKKVNKILIN